MDPYLISGLIRISWLLQFVITICNLRLVGVEMTRVSASFGEPIKDGLSSDCLTEGEREQDSRSRTTRSGTTRSRTTRSRTTRSRTGEDRGDARRIERPVSIFWGGRHSNGELIFTGGTRWKIKQASTVSLCVCGDRSHSGGTRKCERRARTRLRCRETKLAAHLGCRSHQWKMQTSSPSFSSGKTCFISTSFHLRSWMARCRQPHPNEEKKSTE